MGKLYGYMLNAEYIPPAVEKKEGGYAEVEKRLYSQYLASIGKLLATMFIAIAAIIGITLWLS